MNAQFTPSNGMFQIAHLFDLAPLKSGTERWVMLIPSCGAWQVTVEVGDGLKVFATTRSQLLPEQEAKALYIAVSRYLSATQRC